MFIWDFVASTILEQIMDWVYSQIVGFLGNFFAEMSSMGAELFELSWVQSVVLFFSYLAWALFVAGLVVAVFECALEFSNGRGNVRQTAMNILRGFLAVSLFTVVPVRLYELCVSLQSTFSAGLTGYGTSFASVAAEIVNELSAVESLADFESSSIFGFGSITSVILVLFSVILMAYDRENIGYSELWWFDMTV